MELLMKFKRLMLSLVLFAVVVLATPVGFAASARPLNAPDQPVARLHQADGDLDSATDTWHVVVHIIETILEKLSAYAR